MMSSAHTDRERKPGRARRFLHALLLLFATFVLAPDGEAQNTPADAAAESATAQELPRRVVVRFVTDGDYPPFNFLDEDGALAGFNVDLARAICLELAAACDIKVRPWDELFLALRRGEADAAIAGHAVTAQALAQVDFTDRYFHTPGRFVSRRGLVQTDITPETLDGKRIGVAKGSAHEAFVRLFFRDSAIVTFDNADLARDAMSQGKVDFLFDDGVSLSFWLNGTLSRQCCEFVGGPFMEPRFFGDGIAIAVPKTDPQIRQLLNTALKRVRQSGRLDELVQRYFPFRVY
jgi:polar amino acid transport system substrate-binding protein